jgi:hypothetical protein
MIGEKKIFSKLSLSCVLITLMNCNSYASEYQFHKTQFVQPQKESREKENDGYVAMYALISEAFKNYRVQQQRCSVHYPQNASEKQYADSVPKMLSDISNCNSKLYGVPINEKMARDYARSDPNLEMMSNFSALQNFQGNANPHSRKDAQSCADNIGILKLAVMPFTKATGYPAVGWCKK